MTAFDPSSFLDASITEASVKLPPLPVGDYTATIGEIASRAWTGKADASKSGIALDVPLLIDTSSIEGYPPTYSVKDSIMLDLTPGGTIDLAPGKNGKLRRYREALDMNQAGVAFSPRAMQGRLIKVKTKHRTYEGELFTDVDNVAKA